MEKRLGMEMWRTLKEKLFPGRCRQRQRVRERVVLASAEPTVEGSGVGLAAAAANAPDPRPVGEIDFSVSRDLEAYTENLHVPQESIERWISAGLLYPDEIRTAERMIQIIRKKGETAGVA